MFKRRTYLAVFAAVVIIFILAKQLNEEKAPLTINGEPVSEEELAFHDGSLERTVRSREIWNWAAEGGMADEFSYDDLIQSLENENRERKKLQSEGGVLYGPVEYTPLQYYRRLTGERERMLRTRILEKTDSSELIRYYETHQENYMDVDTIEAEYTIRQEGRTIYEGNVVLEAESMRGLSESDEELAEHLMQLEEGGQYRWTGKNGEDKLLNCVRREKGRVIPFEEVAGAVADQYTAERFEQELTKRIADCKVSDRRQK